MTLRKHDEEEFHRVNYIKDEQHILLITNLFLLKLFINVYMYDFIVYVIIEVTYNFVWFINVKILLSYVPTDFKCIIYFHFKLNKRVLH